MSTVHTQYFSFLFEFYLFALLLSIFRLNDSQGSRKVRVFLGHLLLPVLLFHPVLLHLLFHLVLLHRSLYLMARPSVFVLHFKVDRDKR